jgi:hypothetical protein
VSKLREDAKRRVDRVRRLLRHARILKSESGLPQTGWPPKMRTNMIIDKARTPLIMGQPADAYSTKLP